MLRHCTGYRCVPGNLQCIGILSVAVSRSELLYNPLWVAELLRQFFWPHALDFPLILSAVRPCTDVHVRVCVWVRVCLCAWWEHLRIARQKWTFLVVILQCSKKSALLFHLPSVWNPYFDNFYWYLNESRLFKGNVHFHFSDYPNTDVNTFHAGPDEHCRSLFSWLYTDSRQLSPLSSCPSDTII